MFAFTSEYHVFRIEDNFFLYLKYLLFGLGGRIKCTIQHGLPPESRHCYQQWDTIRADVELVMTKVHVGLVMRGAGLAPLPRLVAAHQQSR